ncbi:MAG: CoA-binding protein [Chloroflexi bacterium]|nr:CoA-binding protein [Chloroflexota bacterium]
MKNSKNIAVIGLSDDANRPSHEVAAYLQAHGYRIIPVNPHLTEVLGERAYPDLASIPSDIKVDIVDIFRRPEHTPAIVREALARGVGSIWLQLGISNEDARKLAADAEVPFVQNKCLLVEHRKHHHLLA